MYIYIYVRGVVWVCVCVYVCLNPYKSFEQILEEIVNFANFSVIWAIIKNQCEQTPPKRVVLVI